MHQKNLCQEIYIPATYKECMLSNYGPGKNLDGSDFNAECIHELNVQHLTNGPRGATVQLTWAITTFGIDNIDFMRPGNSLYFKHDADRTMFIMKWCLTSDTIPV